MRKVNNVLLLLITGFVSIEKMSKIYIFLKRKDPRTKPYTMLKGFSSNTVLQNWISALHHYNKNTDDHSHNTKTKTNVDQMIEK